MKMKIDKFSNEAFGDLTTIKSPTTGKIMFVGQEIAKQWGHSNLTQAIKSAKLDRDEFKVIFIKDFPEFREQLTNLGLVSPVIARFTLVSESGLYKLAIASNLEKGQQFRNWIAKEVLPQIRETGSFSFDSISRKDLLEQTVRDVQVKNSIKINEKNYNEGGVPAIIDYNRENCKQVSGMYPNEILKVAGKKSGSAKEVLRKSMPELAATMSLNDHFVDKGAKLEQLKALDTAAINVFKEITKLGFTITD
jgi:prophage antirepressor-like protein